MPETTPAVIQGQPVDQLPTDLYIPPEALRVFLEVFEGPLDFLSYLIRKQNLDILNINVARIAEQYSSYVQMMQSLQFELAADYLAMAAWLTELKSRFLLPRPHFDQEDQEGDPRAELIQRLLEYEQIRSAADSIDQLPRLERDIFLSSVIATQGDTMEPAVPDVSKEELLLAIANVFRRSRLYEHHQIQSEPLSIRERMTLILDKVRDLEFDGSYIKFEKLFSPKEGVAGIVVSLLAIMELLRDSCIELSQNEPFGDIYIKAAEHAH